MIGPVNWYGPTSNLKLLFDRLVCANGGNPREELIDHKNPEKATALEKSPEWEGLSLNHLEGRTAAFFCYSDAGANEMDQSGRPTKLRHKEWFDPEREPFKDMRQAYAPLAWQCRFSGVEVPEELLTHAYTGVGLPYSDNQAEDMIHDDGLVTTFDAWTSRFVRFTEHKGKVEPGLYRAFGYEAPGHRWADVKLKWREMRIKSGLAPEGSSPASQNKLRSTRILGGEPPKVRARNCVAEGQIGRLNEPTTAGLGRASATKGAGGSATMD